MSPIIIYTVIALTSLGIVAAAILFFVAKKFYVKEKPQKSTRLKKRCPQPIVEDAVNLVAALLLRPV
jgi:Na+-translocating ferredoxin:NAD+ oxidoreductase RNF subunit RnfB